MATWTDAERVATLMRRKYRKAKVQPYWNRRCGHFAVGRVSSPCNPGSRSGSTRTGTAG